MRKNINELLDKIETLANEILVEQRILRSWIKTHAKFEEEE